MNGKKITTKTSATKNILSQNVNDELTKRRENTLKNVLDAKNKQINVICLALCFFRCFDYGLKITKNLKKSSKRK